MYLFLTGMTILLSFYCTSASYANHQSEDQIVYRKMSIHALKPKHHQAELRAKAVMQSHNAHQEQETAVNEVTENNAAIRKVEIKNLVGNAKRDFENKIYHAWDVPPGSSGQKANARITLSYDGEVISVIVQTKNHVVRNTLDAAIRAAAPYPMPSDPDARKQARSFSSTFTAK